MRKSLTVLLSIEKPFFKSNLSLQVLCIQILATAITSLPILTETVAWRYPITTCFERFRLKPGNSRKKKAPAFPVYFANGFVLTDFLRNKRVSPSEKL